MKGLLLSLFFISLSAFAATPDTIDLDQLSTGKSLQVLGWKGGNIEDGKVDFILGKDKDKPFIKSKYIVGTEAKYLYREIEGWDAEKLPYLKWDWRVQKFPQGAKILDPKVSDAGAQIYVLWRFFPRYFVLKYFWAGTEANGLSFKDGNAFLGYLFGRILRSGPPMNEWKSETRNVYADFEEAFKQKPPGNVRGIAVLSDGDETKSASEADFANFRASKKP